VSKQSPSFMWIKYICGSHANKRVSCSRRRHSGIFWLGSHLWFPFPFRSVCCQCWKLVEPKAPLQKNEMHIISVVHSSTKNELRGVSELRRYVPVLRAVYSNLTGGRRPYPLVGSHFHLELSASVVARRGFLVFKVQVCFKPLQQRRQSSTMKKYPI
jgi:hypothetical protein